MKRILPLALAVCTAACVPPPAEVRIDGGPRPRVISAPSVLAEGAEVRVVVVDSVWAHAYQVVDSLTDIEPAARAALFAAAELSKLSGVIPLATRTLVSPPPPPPLTVAPGAPFSSIRENVPRPNPAAEADALLAAHAGAAALPAAAERRLRALLPLLQQQRNMAAVLVQQRTDDVNEALEALSAALIEDPGLASLLAFLFNAPAHALADRLAKDPLPGVASRLLLDAAGANSLAIAPDTLLRVLNVTEAYGRRLNSLLAFIPPTVTTPPEEFRAGLEAIRDELVLRNTNLAQMEEADARLRRIVARLGDTSLVSTSTSPSPGTGTLKPFVVAGVDLRPFMEGDSAFDLKLAAVREDLVTVRRQTERLVAVLAQLPQWTRNPKGEEVVLRQRFYGNKDVGLTIARHPRFVTPVLGPEPSAEVRDDGEEDAADGEKHSGGISSPLPLQNKAPETVATVHVPVVQRFRFQLGAGLMRSPLTTERFDTEEDTTEAGPGVYVRRTGTADQRLAPMALLSYTILPLSGKVFDGRAYDTRSTFGDYLRQAGLAAQLGLSMTSPTEEFFFGVSTEPLPGLSVGWGYHTAYLETSSHVGQFVPNSSGISPTEKAWRSTWNAWTVAVDAKVFADVFGSLLK